MVKIDFNLTSAVESRLALFKVYYDYFRKLGLISGDTDLVIKEIGLRIPPRLEKYEQDNNEGPIEVIRNKIEGWQAPYGSASYLFKQTYLPRLATAMKHQYSTMQAMKAVMTTHEAITDQARQNYFDLIDKTTALIGKNTSTRQSSVAKTVVAVVSAIGTDLTALGTLGLGPAGGVVGAVVPGPTGQPPLTSPPERRPDFTYDSISGTFEQPLRATAGLSEPHATTQRVQGHRVSRRGEWSVMPRCRTRGL